jgi:hypothetical protein
MIESDGQSDVIAPTPQSSNRCCVRYLEGGQDINKTRFVASGELNAYGSGSGPFSNFRTIRIAMNREGRITVLAIIAVPLASRLVFNKP